MFSTVFAIALMGVSRAADPAAIEPFNGKDLQGWKLKDEKKSKWKVMQVVVNEKEPNVFSKPATLGDRYELVNALDRGEHGEYEVQILDSYGKPDDKLGQGDLGALYSAAAPKKNAAKRPGEWQKFVIDFQAPKFEGGKKTANAKFIKVVLNDVVLHENVEMKQQTPGGLTGKEAATGPLMFQGDHGAVAFRNIKITPRK